MNNFLNKLQELPLFEITAILAISSLASSGQYRTSNLPASGSVVTYSAKTPIKETLFGLTMELLANMSPLAINKISMMTEELEFLRHFAANVEEARKPILLKQALDLAKLMTSLSHLNRHTPIEHQPSDSYVIKSYVTDAEQENHKKIFDDWITENPGVNPNSSIDKLSTASLLMEPLEQDLELTQVRTGISFRVPSGLLAIAGILIDGQPTENFMSEA